MGDAQKLSPDEQIRSAFEAYEGGKDFTVAVEEEFAILDPGTLELANRFEELQEAAKGQKGDMPPQKGDKNAQKGEKGKN